MPARKKGFTLLELLITVSIIGILAAVGFVVYTQALRQGQDTKRQSDLRSIQSALEQYFADQFYYPKSADLVFNGSSSLSISGKTYLNLIPTDPVGTTQYVYSALPSAPTPCDNSTIKCTNYCLYANLANTPNPIPAAPTGCSYPAGGYDFAVSQP